MTRDLSNSRAARERANRVLWKGGKESTQHPALQLEGMPRYFERGEGCRVWDIDGNCYVDYLMGWGAVLLGHRHPAVERAVRAQLERGSLFGLAVEAEVTLAERLVEQLPGAELVRFLVSGAEATAAAVRIARAATGRELVLYCGFHGWLDWCQNAHPAGIPIATLSASIPLKPGDLDAPRAIFKARGKQVACVVLEPLKGAEAPTSYLAGLRDLAHEHGALLIFDEMKTGYRLGLGGAQALTGITPDLCTFGKALANGYPLSFVAGLRKVFDRASAAWVSGTYHGWPAALAAAGATLTALEQEPVIERLQARGRRLMAGVEQIFGQVGLHARLVGPPSMPELRHAPEEATRVEAVIAAMARSGYHIHALRPWFLCDAHDDEVIEATLADLARVTAQVLDQRLPK